MQRADDMGSRSGVLRTKLGVRGGGRRKGEHPGDFQCTAKPSLLPCGARTRWRPRQRSVIPLPPPFAITQNKYEMHEQKKTTTPWRTRVPGLCDWHMLQLAPLSLPPHPLRPKKAADPSMRQLAARHYHRDQPPTLPPATPRHHTPPPSLMEQHQTAEHANVRCS